MSFDVRQVIQIVITVVLLILGDMGIKWVMPQQQPTQQASVATMPTSYDLTQDSKIYSVMTQFAVMDQKIDAMNDILREMNNRTGKRLSYSDYVDQKKYVQANK